MVKYIISFLEFVVDKSVDDGRLAHVLVSKQDQFKFDLAAHCHGGNTHFQLSLAILLL